MESKRNNDRISANSEPEGLRTERRRVLRKSELAKKLVIKGENTKEFEELRRKILEETLPRTEMENILCERIISAAWKLRRVMEIEKNLLNEQNEITDQERYGTSHPRERVRNIKKVRLSGADAQYLIQYQLELEKALQKAMERLREEQALRNAQGTIPV